MKKGSQEPLIAQRLAIVALVFALLATSGHAAECAHTLNQAQLRRLVEPLTKANGTLHQHLKSLTNELARTPNRGAFDTLSLEYDRISTAYDAALMLIDSLNRTEMLVRLHDLMLDARDKKTLNQYLSVAAHDTRETSQVVERALNELLSRLIRPGLAIDVSKVRDSAAKAAKLFESCP